MTGSEQATSAALFRARGLRVTPQRRAIWGAFEQGQTGHLSAEQVLRHAREAVPELSKSTIYNALNEFVAAGLLVTIESDGVQLYDANVDDHQHFRCLSCGKLYDVHPDGVASLTLAERGFVVERARITFEGTCSSCRR